MGRICVFSVLNVLDWQDKKNCISKAFAAQKRSKKTGFPVTYRIKRKHCCATVVTSAQACEHPIAQLCGLRTTMTALQIFNWKNKRMNDINNWMQSNEISSVSLSPYHCLSLKGEDIQRHSCSAVSLPNQHKDASKTACCRPDLPLPPRSMQTLAEWHLLYRYELILVYSLE